MHAVSAHHDVVVARRGVGEGGPNPCSVIIECRNRHAEADGNPLAQEFVESAVADRDARPDRAPHSGQVHVE
jgi:hypothetical protein